MKASTEPADRLERERLFHNNVFGGTHRVAADRFYTITRRSHELYARMLENLGSNNRVLELGCGDGSCASAFELARWNAKVTGIDLSEIAVDKARQRAIQLHFQDSASFQRMNAEELTFPADTFDLICGMGILHHLDLDKVLPEISRTLKATGSAVFIEPLGHNPLIELYRRATPNLRTPDEHPLRMSDLKNARKHFEKIEPQFFHLVSLAGVPFRKFRWFSGLLTTLDRVDEMLFQVAPFVKRFAWHVVLLLSAPRKAQFASPDGRAGPVLGSRPAEESRLQ